MTHGPLGRVFTLDDEAGAHTDSDGKECSGRTFKITSVGVGGVYSQSVTCLVCRQEMQGSDAGLIISSHKG
jgi:hypothetical protein